MSILYFMDIGCTGPGTKNLKNIFWLVRDGRDVMISQYYHSLVWNEKKLNKSKRCNL